MSVETGRVSLEMGTDTVSVLFHLLMPAELRVNLADQVADDQIC